ncbi:MAG: hypothetical protein JNL72_02930, partial [Flavipsychrobacter sp.]|nr:hypothetical protein [Flavipsychrobacter sp.]
MKNASFTKTITMNKLILIGSVVLSAFSMNSNAQQWEWGKRGGSPTPATNNVEETVYDIATDKWGNIYTAARAYTTGMNVGGNNLNGYGGVDIVLSSFACDGTYRWSKVIGSALSDGPAPSIKCDTLGGIYATFSMVLAGQMGNVDTDTTLTSNYKRLYLVKYDTAGTYQWLRTPQDTSTLSSNLTTPIDMDVDGGGNIFMFCYLYPGSYGNSSYIVNDTGEHILRYNSQGTLVQGIPLQMEITESKLNYVMMKRNHLTGRYYFTGSASNLLGGSVILNGNQVNNPMYITSFNAQGQYLWKRENINQYAWGFRGRPVVDDSGNVYVCGASWHNDTFMTYHVVNTLMTAGGDQPFIAKLDSNGNLKWAKAGSADGATNGYSIAMRNNNEVVMVGSYPGKVQWPGYAGPHPNHGNNQNSDVFITSFNSHTGAVNDVDTLGGVFGGFDEPTCIVADRNNNVYLGGR